MLRAICCSSFLQERHEPISARLISHSCPTGEVGGSIGDVPESATLSEKLPTPAPPHDVYSPSPDLTDSDTTYLALAVPGHPDVGASPPVDLAADDSRVADLLRHSRSPTCAAVVVQQAGQVGYSHSMSATGARFPGSGPSVHSGSGCWQL